MRVLECRQIITAMLLFGNMVKEMSRVNINIAIVDMIEHGTTDTNKTYVYEGKETRFQLTESQKHHLLSAYFYGNMMFDVIGGYLLDMVGPRVVLGTSMTISAIVTVFTPLVGLNFGYIGLLVVRGILGITGGCIFPSAIPLAFNWFSKEQHHKFIAIMASGPLGVAMSFPLFSLLLPQYGWGSVFYCTTVVTFVFCILWFCLVYDTPDKHPRISLDEKLVILGEVDENNGLTKNLKVPWKKLVSSNVVWTLMIALACHCFVYYFILTQLPYYLSNIHGLKIEENGVFSSIPLFFFFVSALIYGYIADKMIQSKKYETLFIRRIFTSIALLLLPITLILQGCFGYILVPSIVLFVLANTFASAIFTGVGATILDVVPSYGGIITTFSNTVASLMVIGMTEIMVFLTKDGSNYINLRKIFFIIPIFQLAAWAVFMICANNKTKTWNFTD